MLTFLLKLKRRIQRLLRVRATSRQKYVRSTRIRVIRTLMLVVTSLMIVLLYPAEDLYDPFDTPRKGEIAREAVIAPFPIAIYKSQQEYADSQEAARASVPLVLAYDTTISRIAHSRLASYVSLVDSLREAAPTPTPGQMDESFQIVSNRFPLLSHSTINRSLNSTEDLKLMRERIDRIYDEEIYRIGFLESWSDIPASRVQKVLIRRNGDEALYPRERLLDKALAWNRLLTVLNSLASTDNIDVDFYYPIAKHFMRSNLRPDIARYNTIVADSLDAVPKIKNLVDEGDIIVRAGQKVTRAQEETLKEMARVMRDQAAEESRISAYLPLLGRILMVLAIFGALYMFLHYFRREIFQSMPRLFAMFLVYLIQLALVYFVGYVAELLDVQAMYVYPIAILPILITILFDAEIGVLSTIVLALLLGVMHRFSFVLVLMTVVIGMAACFSSRRVRKRTDFYRIMLLVVAAYVVVIFAVENLSLNPAADILMNLIYGAATGILATAITIFLLPFFESLFGFTTDITLLELSDLNHPLLKRLALEAPGTYHHTISVGNLSEAAAIAINANSLLARVGTYYHDIGKMEIPEYFVENQLSVTSKHEALTPSMSAIILTSHVKKGRALGEESGIPDDVLNFIEEHHGTMVMSYFYNKALQQGADEESIDKFRYPGPKPQSRETGISMLADAVEAASRTLDDPTSARLTNLIQRIINERFQSGELDECPLTLRDLAKIREAFAQVLMASFHHRVEYPKKEEAVK